MPIINTENLAETTHFENALLNSLPSFNGLWFPKNIDKLPENFINNIENYSFNEIAFTVLKNITTFKLDDNKLKKVIKKAFNFPVIVKELDSKLHILETFHGPTLTFKDFGARFLACYLEEYLSDSNEKYNVLVSTSGDTGSAIASAFYKIPNIKVTILYPKNRVSQIQEIQMTTFGENIVSYCIENNFDQCQTMVKKAFIDKDIEINLISANSINLGRLLPQSIYYFYSYAQLKKKYGNKVVNNVVFSVPCGNCGNLTGGLIAKKMGLPVKFIASQNKNSVFVDYLNSGIYSPIISEKTYSNAMDVGDPSNVKRIDYLYNSNYKSMQDDISSNICNEIQTMIDMREVYEKYHYVMDPHTAVSYNGVKNYNGNKDSFFIIVSTADPVKFRYSVKKATGVFPKLNSNLKLLSNMDKYIIGLDNDYNTFISNINKSFNKNCSITLIGMPGTGKTVVSKYISTKKPYNLIELDEYIEKKHNMTLFQLIDKYGDEGFKKIEEEALLSIDLSIRNVISTGGSVVYSEKGMEYLKNNNNLIVYLNTSFNVLVKRTENFTNRGMVFNGLTPNQLYLSRHDLYKKYADVTIDCDNLEVDQIGNIIINYFNM